MHMSAVNSTTVLEKLRIITDGDAHRRVDIHVLADCMGVSVSVLVSVLTELEHRDEIKLDITISDANELTYTGTVQIMPHVL